MKEAQILIVDDDEALLEALPEALRLRMNGIAIDTSGTAFEALERIREIDYDAIVSDIKLPGMDGLELLTEIKQLRPGTPTLLITGHGEHDLAVRALRGGAYDFVQKPIDRDYFVASLERAIRMRRLDRRVEEQRVALERHARVLDRVDNGVFVVDRDGLIQGWNAAAHAITGFPSGAVVRRKASQVLPGWSAVQPGIPVASDPGSEGRDATVPLEIDGREMWLSISGVEFDGGVVYAFRNLTEERALDELKSDFVATVSHELRTPLAAIYGCARTLLRPDLDLRRDDSARLLEVIAQESERLTRIVSDILLANQIDSGRLRLQDQAVDVTGLARDVVDEIHAALLDGREDISLELVAPDRAAVVCGDEDRLRQVLLNLVDNAVKYSPDGGRVQVELEPRAGGLRIAVRDEGLGIPHGEQQRIFGKFYRVDPQQTRGVGGTGLGLYICRELVRRMEGRVSVTSREGEGSTFVVDIPLAPVPAREAQPA